MFLKISSVIIYVNWDVQVARSVKLNIFFIFIKKDFASINSATLR